MSHLEQLLYLLLGWCLGLLGPSVVDRIRREHRTAELISAILVELHELQYKFAIVCYLMRRRRALMPDSWLAWFESIVRNYSGPEPQATILQSLRALRALSEDDRRQHLLTTYDPTRGLTLKEFAAPLLTAHVTDVSTFPIAFQAAVLRIRSQIDSYNQHVKHLQSQFDKTFSATGSNLEAIRSNLESGYDQLGEMATRIVDVITRVPRPKAHPGGPAQGAASLSAPERERGVQAPSCSE